MKNSNLINQIPDKINNVIAKKMHANIFGIPLPAKILKYDYSLRTADVKCLINISDGHGGFIEGYVMADVPVVSHSTSKGIIPLKIQVGDEGIVIITPIGIENWHLDGGIQDEHLPTKGGLQNCFFFPSSFRQVPNQLNLLKNISDQISKISDSLGTLANAVGTIASTTTTGAPANQPQPLIPATVTTLNAAKTQIQSNMTQLASLKQLFDKAYDI